MAASGANDSLSSYIHIEFLLGNRYYYHQKISVEEPYGTILYGNSSEELSIIMNSCDNTMNFWYEYETKPKLTNKKIKKAIKKEINQNFNSKYGLIYYKFFSNLPSFVNDYVEELLGDTSNHYVYIRDVDINKLAVFLNKKSKKNKIKLDISAYEHYRD